jgi:hypothetical protein
MSTATLTTADGLLARLVDASLDALFTFRLHVSATDVARAVSVMSLGVVFGLVVSF